jgi:hypothetical protein
MRLLTIPRQFSARAMRDGFLEGQIAARLQQRRNVQRREMRQVVAPIDLC